MDCGGFFSKGISCIRSHRGETNGRMQRIDIDELL